MQPEPVDHGVCRPSFEGSSWMLAGIAGWHTRPMQPPRSAEQRKADALAKLSARHADLWIASASSGDSAHLVPLSFAWDGENVIIATDSSSATARNVADSGRARLALGGTRDVVAVDVLVVERIDLAEAPRQLADRYAMQAAWDPRSADGNYVYILLRPDRIQVWGEENEIAGRTIMRGGARLA